MPRAQRLLKLIQILRRHRFAVSGAKLANELDISLRTLYRDIQSLQEQGANIQGEAGLGYILKPGFMLPPLMFTDDEIEALVLGTRWVSDRADKHLAQAAKEALSKISAVLPADLKASVDASPLLVGPGEALPVDSDMMQIIRHAIRDECKLQIHYEALDGSNSSRIVWPFALGYFDRVRLLTCRCELRDDFRNFRIDRIVSLRNIGQRYPYRRQVLLQQWRLAEGIHQA